MHVLLKGLAFYKIVFFKMLAYLENYVESEGERSCVCMHAYIITDKINTNELRPTCGICHCFLKK